MIVPISVTAVFVTLVLLALALGTVWFWGEGRWEGVAFMYGSFAALGALYGSVYLVLTYALGHG